jgi:hypothetical protein
MPPRQCLLLLLALAAGAQELAPEVVLLARIKRHMTQVLSRQPNYTCLETIERSRRSGKNRRFELVDALHLEVAVVDGKEMFSWPGEREFRDRDLRELAPTGAIGNGSFAIHARSVFMSEKPLITYQGEEQDAGRTLVRYDYSVPQYRSGYRLRVGKAEGIMGYRGSFWVERETLDLVRLAVESTEIPPHIPLKHTSDAMRYARVPIGDATFLLPLSAEMVMQDFYGGENRNVITFSRCRQYSGESSLSFDEAPEDAVAQPTAPPVPIALPEGLLVEIDLQTPVNFPGSAIGDEIEGRIHRDVKRKGKVVIPKGALVKGNVVLLERRRDMRGQVRILVALSWREISFDGKSGPFEGQLEEGGAIPASDISNRGLYLRPGLRERGMLPHRDVFYVRKDTLNLPRGLPLLWRTGGSGKKQP